jgi:hypothetical protein
MAKKSWKEKFHVDKRPEVKRLEKPFADMAEGTQMLIATPPLLAEYLRQVPFGKEVDVKTIRKDLALAHQADTTCPVTTGIFLRIVAEASQEDFLAGTAVDDLPPFWRAISPTSNLAKKLSFGIDWLVSLRKAEGILD